MSAVHPHPALSGDQAVPPALAAFVELARTRRSIRRYKAEPVADDLIVSLLEAACWAPSAHNRQPWRFCVVRSPEVKAALSGQMAAVWRADLARDGADPAQVEQRVAASHARLTGAPAGGKSSATSPLSITFGESLARGHLLPNTTLLELTNVGRERLGMYRT